jgi:DNA gyrase/topoisomerase IV subunit A
LDRRLLLPSRLLEWSHNKFSTVSAIPKSNIPIIIDSVLFLYENWPFFAEMRFRNSDSHFVKAVMPLIGDQRVIVRASISLTGTEFENDMKLKLLSINRETFVKKCDLKSSFCQFPQFSIPCDKIRKDLETSRAEGRQLTETLEQLSQRLEILRKDIREERNEGNSEEMKETLSKLKEERSKLTDIVQSSITFSTLMRDTLVGHRKVQDELQELVKTDRQLVEQFREGNRVWRESLNQMGMGS